MLVRWAFLGSALLLWTVVAHGNTRIGEGEDGGGGRGDATAASAITGTRWNVVDKSRNDNNAIDGQYIVYFDETNPPLSADDIKEKAAQVSIAMGGEIVYIYQYAFAGVLLRNVTREQNENGNNSLDGIVSGIQSIQQDRRFALDVLDTRATDGMMHDTNSSSGTDTDAAGRFNSSNTNSTNTTNTGTTTVVPAPSPVSSPISPPVPFSPPPLPAGLDRIDQVSLPLDGKPFQSNYDGTGVTIFVLDSGIRMNHVEFTTSNSNNSTSSRVVCGFDFYGTATSGASSSSNNNAHCMDGFNHGTHVAGTAAGRNVGLAKNATIVAVKIFDNSGSSSDAAIAAGIDYVIGQKRRRPDTPMVANLSFGRLGRLAKNTLVKRAVNAGIVMVVSAGNDGIHVRRKTPANARNAITVGASQVDADDNRKEGRADFSNFGRLIDIFAPGVRILSASARGIHSAEYVMFTGTSMATPHVTGAVALYLQKHANWSPRRVRHALVMRDATCGKLTWRSLKRFSPNKLLYIGRI